MQDISEILDYTWTGFYSIELEYEEQAPPALMQQLFLTLPTQSL